MLHDGPTYLVLDDDPNDDRQCNSTPRPSLLTVHGVRGGVAAPSTPGTHELAAEVRHCGPRSCACAARASALRSASLPAAALQFGRLCPTRALPMRRALVLFVLKASGSLRLCRAANASSWAHDEPSLVRLPDGSLACPTLRTRLSSAGELSSFPSHVTGSRSAPWWDINSQLVAWHPALARRCFGPCVPQALQLVPFALEKSSDDRPFRPSEIRLMLRAVDGARLPPGGMLMLQPCCTHPSFAKEWAWAWHEDPVPCLRPTEISADGTTGVLAFNAHELERAAGKADRFWFRHQYSSLGYKDPKEGVHRVVFLYAPQPKPGLGYKLRKALSRGWFDDRTPMVALEVAQLHTYSSLIGYSKAYFHRDIAEPAADGVEPPLTVA